VKDVCCSGGCDRCAELVALRLGWLFAGDGLREVVRFRLARVVASAALGMRWLRFPWWLRVNDGGSS
jgi:hypothetical protein